MMRRAFGRATVGVLTASLAGCSAIGDRSTATPTTVDSWGSFRGDPRRTGRVPAEAGPGESIAFAWELTGQDVLEHVGADELSASIQRLLPSRASWPVVAGDLVIWKATLEWLDDESRDGRRRGVAHYLVGAHSSGSIEWARSLTGDDEGGLEFGPEVDGGTVYQPTMRDNGLGIAVVDPVTGDRERTLDLGLPTATSLLVDDGSIFAAAFGANDRGLFAFDADSGAEQWSVEASPHPQEGPFGALHEAAILYFAQGANATEIVARDTADGSVDWRTPVELSDPSRLDMAIQPAPPTVADEIYAAGSHKTFTYRNSAPIVSFDADDGTERFQYEPPGLAGETNPVPDWLAEQNDEVPDGADLPPFAALYGLPLVIDDLVVASGYGAVDGTEAIRHCYAIDRDGSFAWSIENDLSFAPVAAGDVIYLASWAAVTAVSTDGQQLDSVSLGDEDSSPVRARYSPAIGHGHLYVPTDDGLVAIGSS